MAPTDRALLLPGLANQVDALASRFGSTELELFQCVRVLGPVMELRTLRGEGFPCYRSEGRWCVDSRSFRTWVEGLAGAAGPVARPEARTGALL